MKYFKFGNINIVYTEKEDGNQRDKKLRKNVAEKFNFENIVIPNQKHTNKVVTVNSLETEADGIYTDKKNIPVGILTADCVPVVLFNSKELSVVHCGWRGMFDGIIQNAVNMFKEGGLKAFIGANIKGCCYEVQEDFIKNFEKKYKADKFFEKNKGSIHFNLNRFVKYILSKDNIEIVYEVEFCTKCDDNLFSYRKGHIEERILTFSWISD